MCIDYTKLIKACPKDAYLLPNIDGLVDGASDHKMLSFLDANLGYNQIPMYAPNQEKTTFITEKANYYYEVIPFGIKNIRAIYHCLMNKIPANQIGWCMDVYVDDMVVRSNSSGEHIKDLEEVFRQVWRYNLRLNLAKCTFSVGAGKFFGFMLIAQGIKVNLNK